MKQKRKFIFSNFKHENWNNLLLFAVFSIYLSQIGFLAVKAHFSFIADDYLGYWSVGKIADKMGYSKIYDLEILRSVQTQELKANGFLAKEGDASFFPIPAPYFAFFILPFQLLSRVGLQYSYWLWTISNLAILIGYLVFFLRKTLQGETSPSPSKKILLLLLLSFSVFINLVEGQINIFLLVCVGEFIRHALNKKPIFSGIWLAGLLLKPQLLILIVPIILLTRYWKVLMGFVASSSVIFLISLWLSGFAGMKDLFSLWTMWGEANIVTAPEAMINWRMIGAYLNAYLNTTFGWVATGLGIALTVLAVYFLVKRNAAYGSPDWVITILGVFASTLAITWHAHYHMAMVLIPFLSYSMAHKLLPEKLVFSWVVTTPVVWFGMGVFGIIILLAFKLNINNYHGMVIALSGFVVNLVIIISAFNFVNKRNVQKE